ncbi:hypothetical protein HMPREF9056_01584 [Actinomyces sp. oral taxon 170 str. F0386]|nr:hypothetical protein HMPREF9056_01584 [Actinomyces sp. oral taxon 170 str. F0386]
MSSTGTVPHGQSGAGAHTMDSRPRYSGGDGTETGFESSHSTSSSRMIDIPSFHGCHGEHWVVDGLPGTVFPRQASNDPWTGPPGR